MCRIMHEDATFSWKCFASSKIRRELMDRVDLVDRMDLVDAIGVADTSFVQPRALQ